MRRSHSFSIVKKYLLEYKNPHPWSQASSTKDNTVGRLPQCNICLKFITNGKRKNIYNFKSTKKKWQNWCLKLVMINFRCVVMKTNIKVQSMFVTIDSDIIVTLYGAYWKQIDVIAIDIVFRLLSSMMVKNPYGNNTRICVVICIP